MLRVGQLTHLQGRVFATVVNYGGDRPLELIDRVRRQSDGAVWTVQLEDGPVAYSENGVVVGDLVGLFVEGDAVLEEGDELSPV